MLSVEQKRESVETMPSNSSSIKQTKMEGEKGPVEVEEVVVEEECTTIKRTESLTKDEIDTGRFDEIKPGKVRKTKGYTRAFAKGAMSEELRKLGRPVMIMGLLFLESPLDVETMRKTLGARMLSLPHFRSVMQYKKGKAPKWVEVAPEEIDLVYHFHKVEQEKALNQKGLSEFLSNLNETSLDYEKPMWRFHYLEKMEEGKPLLIAQIDHTICDGTTAVAVLKDVLMDPKVKGETKNGPGGKPSVKKMRAKPQLSFAGKTGAFFGGIRNGVLGPLLPGDTRTKLKVKDHRNPSKSKSCAFTETIDLDKIKEIKNQFPGASVNDICLCLMTMTLRSYYEEIQDPIMKTKKTVRGNFPLDLRKPGKDILKDQFGNKFSTPYFRFPLHYKSCEDLVWQIKRQIEITKISPEPKILNSTINSVAKLPPVTMKNLALDASGKVTSMLSNVMGPSDPVHICGTRVEHISFIACSPIGLYFGVISAFNKLSASIVLDYECEPDATKLAKHWLPSFEKLYADTVTNHPEKFKQK